MVMSSGADTMQETGMGWTEEAVARRKRDLEARTAGPLSALARDCEAAWPSPEELDLTLTAGLAGVPHCHLLYALDTAGRQVSANVAREGTEEGLRGQDLSRRPYLTGNLPFRGLQLSPAYLSRATGVPCITALYPVRTGDRLLGFVAADFHIHEVAGPADETGPCPAWGQFRGDPAIRGTLFQQQRHRSRLDQNADAVLGVLEALLRRHGIFHTKIHFSSSRATLWSVEDPYTYRIHGVDELLQPELCLAYPPRPYPERAGVAEEAVGPILHRFRELREADETVYLRSASVNLINETVGLTFSCDGSHYMAAGDFLERGLDYWLGGAAQNTIENDSCLG
jgi:hypothetical protein